METKEIIYFDEPGSKNTRDVIKAAKKRAKELNISHIVIASTQGDTALKAREEFGYEDVSIVCVGEHSGFKGGIDHQLLPDNIRKELEDKGVKVLICSHALSGVERSISKKFGGVSRVEIIAGTLRQFGGEGIKVAVEISIMAADAGLISTLEPCLSLGGTGQGVDTAVLLRPAHAQNFFDLRILEISAKPHFL